MKLTDQVTAHEMAGHEHTEHENANHRIAGQELKYIVCKSITLQSNVQFFKIT